VGKEFLFDGVAIKSGDRAQPPGDGGPSSPAGFQVAREALDVGATGGEQAQLMLLALAGELAQVQLIGLAGQAAVAGHEAG
jgi:hypothetical protein